MHQYKEPWNPKEPARGPGRGHPGHSGGWQETEGNHTHYEIHLPIQQKPQARGLEGYGSSSSAPPTPQRYFSMEHGKQEVQPSITLAELRASFQKICLREISFKDLMEITRGWNPTRKFRLLEERATRIRENEATIQAIEQLNQTGPNLIPSGSQGVDQTNSPVDSHHSGIRRSVAKIHHSSQSQVVYRRRQEYKGKNKTSFSQRQKEISSPNNRNINPTQDGHSVVTPESNINSYALCLKMSQFAEKTQKQLEELQESHERMKTLTASMDKILKTFQEGHAQLSKASEETN
ncbi:hypothetical protein O181_025789 [Austropuccinia psidii MF-1]|uniref:Uncharacterized protein n=1 Tax=Austropuccinia psidii MF-1 TaxID=1389203 RepID=A0A9Q3CIR3_9BASI|nr:hypothetical protein [Austropuccinia psidii MF-1]